MEDGSLVAGEEIRELATLPKADWDVLSAGRSDPFGIEHLQLSWRPKDTHFLLYRDGRAASHVSVLLRHTVRVGSDRIAVTGVAGIITRPDLRHRGLATRVLRHALDATRHRARTSFGFLFCLRELVPLYEARGWREVCSVVRIQQPAGVVEAPLRAMILPLHDQQWPAGPVCLGGPPW